jgi:hypothetical protein
MRETATVLVARELIHTRPGVTTRPLIVGWQIYGPVRMVSTIFPGAAQF